MAAPYHSVLREAFGDGGGPKKRVGGPLSPEAKSRIVNPIETSREEPTYPGRTADISASDTVGARTLPTREGQRSEPRPDLRPISREPEVIHARERRPEPMIKPGVGPVHQLEQKTAHTFGYTPEAYRELSSIPTRLDLREGAGVTEQGELGGLYYPKSIFRDESMLLYQDDPAILAHEQAHAHWARQGYDMPDERTGFKGAFDRWVARDEQDVGGYSPAISARDDFERAKAFYPFEGSVPTELHSRAVQLSPGQDRRHWPNDIRPYYAGFLQGMNRPMAQDPLVERMEPSWSTYAQERESGREPEEWFDARRRSWG